MPGGFNASSKLLQKKWDEKKYQMHRQKMLSMKSDLSDYKNPKSDHAHLVLRVKKVQKEEERQAQIDHENQLLIQRMTRIMRSRGAIDNWNDYETRSMNVQKRAKEQERIAEANVGFARRLEKVKSKYDSHDWEENYQRHAYYLDMMANTTKDYTSPRNRRKQADNDHQKSSSTVTTSQGNYDSDFEDPEDTNSEQEKLPKIESRGSSNKENSRRRNRKKESSVTRLPDIKNKADTKKTEDNDDKRRKKSKYRSHRRNSIHNFDESGSTSEGSTEENAASELDAKLLFKVTKKMANPDEIILKTLIKKSHAQRMATKDKFEDMYDSSLEEKLKSLEGDYEPLVECLLAERESRDAEALNTFIHNNDVQSLINLFCFRNQSAINSINNSYEDKFDVSIREDIEHRILNENCQTLLIALLDCNKSKGNVDEDQAQEDAKALFQAERGRFTDSDGNLLELFKSRSLPHIKATLNCYRSASDGEDIASSMKTDGCSKDYIDAMLTITKCMNNGAMLNAEKIHALIASGKKKELISLLMARAEIDMPDIRKAYKKKYGQELIDDIMSKCGNTGPLIAHIAAKQGKANSNKEQGKGQGKDGKGQGTDGKGQGKDSKLKGTVSVPPPVKKSPARRPEPKKESDMKNNPLAQQSQKKDQQPMKDQGKKDEKATKGTIMGPKKFDPDGDVEKIHAAVKGFGTDEQPLIDILAFRTNAQRQEIKKKYKDKYNEDLMDVMKSELTGDFEEITLALLMLPVEYDAYCLHDAVHGPGTKEAALIGIMCTRTSKELKAIKAEYKKTYKNTLDDDLKGDTSGDFEDMLLELSKGEREQGDTVDKKQAEDDAKQLYKSEDNMLDVESETFKNLLCKKNKAQIRATFEHYNTISGQTIEDGIEQAWINLGDSADGYSGLAEAMQDTAAFYAARLQDALDRSGTNDTQLIRIVVSRSEIDLADIRAKYKNLTAKSLEKSIEDDTSGDYKKMLLAIVKDKILVYPKVERVRRDRMLAEYGTVWRWQASQRMEIYIVKDEDSASKYRSDEKRKIKNRGKIRQRANNSDFDSIPSTSDGRSTDQSEWRHRRRRQYRSMYCMDCATQTDFENDVLHTRSNDDIYGNVGDREKSGDDGKVDNDDDEHRKTENTNENDNSDAKNENEDEEEDSFNYFDDKSDSEAGSKVADDKSDSEAGSKVADDKSDSEAGSKVADDKSDSEAGSKIADDEDIFDFFEEKQKLNNVSVAKKADVEKNVTNENHVSISKKDEVEKNGTAEINAKDSENKADTNADEIDDSTGNMTKHNKGDKDDELSINDENVDKSKTDSINKSTKKSKNKAVVSQSKKRKESEADTIMKYGSLWRLKEQRAKEKGLRESVDGKAVEATKDNGNYPEYREESNEPVAEPEAEPEEEVDDLEKLHRALTSDGGESVIIKHFSGKTVDQRQQARKEYKDRYNKDLIEMIEIKLHGEFEHFVVASLLSPAEYDAECIQMSIIGFKTNEAFIRSDGMLVSQSNKNLQAMKEHYKESYGKDLEAELRADCSSSSVDLVLGLVSGERDENMPIDDALALSVSEKLYNNGNHKLHPCNDEVFKDLLTKYSYEQIRHTLATYEKMTKETIEQGMEKCGCTEKVLINTVKAIHDPVEFYTERLHEALAGSGTDSTAMIRIVISKSENDLPKIKEKYKELYDKTLEEVIEQDCPGHYKDMLLAFISNCPATNQSST